MPHPLGSGIKRWCCLMSVANIGPKSRTQKPRKTKIGTEVAHGHHFQGQKVKVQGHRGGVLYCGSLPLSSLSYCMYVKRVCLQHSSRTAGKTKAIMEWVFVLCSCRFRMNSVPCSVHGFMFHLLRNHQQWQHDIYRQDAAKWQTAGIKFNHRPKIRFFAPQGRLVLLIHVKFGMADGHLGTFGCAKFHLNGTGGGNVAPKISVNFHFLVKPPHRGEPLDRFLKFLHAFIRLNIIH